MKKIIAFLCILVLSASAASVSHKKNVEYLHNIKELVIATQKIRGATYNFLSGSEFAQFSVFEERSKTKKVHKKLKQMHATVDEKTNAKIDGLGKKLRHLNKIALELEPLVAFKAYSLLISNMIALGNDVSKDLLKQNSALTKQVSTYMFTSLLPLTEAVGKIRGIGSGIIARTYCEEEEAELLEGYVDEALISLTDVTRGANTLAKSNKDYPADLNLKTLSDNINTYIYLVHTKVLKKEQIDYNSNKYFDEGTAIISQILNVYDINEKLIDKTQ